MQQEKNYPYLNMLLEDIKGEIWKDVPDFEGYYKVSNKGRIKSLARELNFYREGKTRVRLFIKEDKIMKQSIRASKKNSFRGDYIYHATYAMNTELTKRGGSVARLVYRVFVADISKMGRGVVVSHLDGDPLNNRVENLYLQTVTELNKRNIKSGRLIAPRIKELPQQTQIHIYKDRKKVISQYSLEGNWLATYSSITEACRKYNLSNGNLILVLNIPEKTCGGFVWRRGDSREKIDTSILLRRVDTRVSQYNLEGNYIATHNDWKEASQKTKIKSSYILDCLRGKIKSTHGYIWKWKSEDEQEKSGLPSKSQVKRGYLKKLEK